ncbi:MAG: DUF3786 domain-containing protein [Thermodesulforhabdaceae bacterium]|jgi:hypothetical protein
MSKDNYESIILSYLPKAFERGIEVLKEAIPAEATGDGLLFKAFGANCLLTENAVMLDGVKETGPKGVLISIYALHAPTAQVSPSSWKAFRDFPNTMPYWGAFRSNAEEILVPYVEAISGAREKILERFGGNHAPDSPGDFALILWPLPKVPLLYIFYLPDEEFPAEAKCLFADEYPFMPVDAMADVAEYTSRSIINLVKKGTV